jgi:hypothetical protein
MTTSQLTGTVNPLTELPAVGGVISVVHSMLTDLGIPLWIAESIELTVLLLVTYLLLRQVFTRLLPWLAAVAAPTVDPMFDRLAMVLLMPEYAVTRLLTRTGKAPFVVTYTYGEGVTTVVGVIRSVAHVLLGVLPRLRRISKAVPIVLTALLALAWNSETCMPAGPDACVSPASHWIAEADKWFTEKSS